MKSLNVTIPYLQNLIKIDLENVYFASVICNNKYQFQT